MDQLPFQRYLSPPNLEPKVDLLLQGRRSHFQRYLTPSVQMMIGLAEVMDQIENSMS